jgi:tRNA A37 threonylcarbamoyladenosine biosynthesis protein TsaE
VVVLEWADKVDEKQLGDHIRVEFEHSGETSRRLMFQGRGEQSAEFVRALNLSP